MPKRHSDMPMLDNPVLRHLIQPLSDLTRWFDAHFVPHAVFGPVADAILWQPRLRCTIDVLAATPSEGGFVHDALAFGFRDLERGVFLHEPAQVEMRLRAPATELERQAVVRALRIHLYDIAVSVVSPRDHIALTQAADQDVTELLAAFPDAEPAELMAVRRPSQAPPVLSAVG